MTLFCHLCSEALIWGRPMERVCRQEFRHPPLSTLLSKKNLVASDYDVFAATELIALMMSLLSA